MNLVHAACQFNMFLFCVCDVGKMFVCLWQVKVEEDLWI